jgi:hypothetical protein
MGFAEVVPTGRAVGLERKRPLMGASPFSLMEGRVEKGGEKMRMSEEEARRRWDSEGVMMGSLKS